ncbi:Myristylated protein G9R [Salmon gill poxvirus]
MGLVFDFPLPQYQEYYGPEFTRKFNDVVLGLYSLNPGDHVSIGMSPPPISTPEFDVYKKSESFWEIRRKSYYGAPYYCCRINQPYYFMSNNIVSTQYLSNSTLYTCNPNINCHDERITMCVESPGSPSCRIAISQNISNPYELRKLWHVVTNDCKNKGSLCNFALEEIRQQVFKIRGDTSDIQLSVGNSDSMSLLYELEQVLGLIKTPTTYVNPCNDPVLASKTSMEITNAEWIGLRKCKMSTNEINVNIPTGQKVVPDITILTGNPDQSKPKFDTLADIKSKLNFLPDTRNKMIKYLMILTVFCLCFYFFTAQLPEVYRSKIERLFVRNPEFK